MSNENARKDIAHVSSPANPQDCSGVVGDEHLDKVAGGSVSDQFPDSESRLRTAAPHKVV
jgi:hypothetical protein